MVRSELEDNKRDSNALVLQYVTVTLETSRIDSIQLLEVNVHLFYYDSSIVPLLATDLQPKDQHKEDFPCILSYFYGIGKKGIAFWCLYCYFYGIGIKRHLATCFHSQRGIILVKLPSDSHQAMFIARATQQTFTPHVQGESYDLSPWREELKQLSVMHFMPSVIQSQQPISCCKNPISLREQVRCYHYKNELHFPFSLSPHSTSSPSL